MEGKDHNNRSGGRGGRQRERELGERQKERVGGGVLGSEMQYETFEMQWK